MKNKKEFFGVLISVLVSVFFVFLVVYATTIGSDITVDDDLTVTDDLIVNGLASVSETFRVPTIYGNTDSGLYLRIGDQALTSHSLDTQDDLLITGELEVDGTAYFDGAASLSDSGTLRVANIVGHTDAGQYLRIGDVAATGHSLDADDDLLVNGELEVDGTAYFDGAASVALDLSVEGGDFSVSGDATITGNDLIFGNGGTIVNTSADKLTITEAEVLFSAIASVSTDLWVDRIYGTLGAGYLSVGDAGTTGHSLAAEDDLLVTGKLEVDGTAYFDGLVSVSDANGIQVGGGGTLKAGTASISGSCTIGDVYIRTGTAGIDNILSICDETNEWTAADL